MPEVGTRLYDGSAKPQKTDTKMKRTLFIGIGGTGKEVLMRLRRRFYESFHTPYGYDFVRFLWIDTDITNKGIADKDWDSIDENITFSVRDGIPEKFDASIQPQTLMSLYNNLNTYPHIRNWLPLDKLRPLGFDALLNGARAIRPLGRLAFSWHSAAIRELLDKNIKEKLNQTYPVNSEITPSEDIEVYIIGSLAGGTGSGMFLELGKMLKAHYESSSHYGVFFLSDMFGLKGENNDRDANCYASLQELDFYQTASNIHDPLISKNRNLFQYISSDGRVFPFVLPLYSNVFLVTNEYYKHKPERVFHDPFDMVADILYLDFDKSQFGVQKRSVSVNRSISGSRAAITYRKEAKGKEVTIEWVYHSDYSAFGLAGVFLNISKLRNWAIYQYLSDMLGSLIEDRPANREKYTDREGKLRIKSLNYDKLRHFITYGPRNETFLETYKQSLQKAFNDKTIEILKDVNLNSSNILNINTLCESIVKKLRPFFEQQENEVRNQLLRHDKIVGRQLKELENNLNFAVESVLKDIEALFYQILADYHDGGVLNAKQFLDACIDQIAFCEREVDMHKNRFEKYEPTIPGEPQFDLQGTIEEIINLDRETDLIPWIFFGYKAKAKEHYDQQLQREINRVNGSMKATCKNYMNGYLQHLSELIQNQWDNVLFDLVRQTLQKIREGITITRQKDKPCFSARLSEYTIAVKRYKQYFTGYSRSFEQEIDEEIHRKLNLDSSVMSKKDIIDNMKNKLPDGQYNWFARAMNSKYLSQMQSTGIFKNELGSELEQFIRFLSYLDVVDTVKLPDIPFTCREICREQFQGFMEDTSVLEEFHRQIRQNKPEVKAKMNALLSAASFRLAMTDVYPDLTNRITSTKGTYVSGLETKNVEVEAFLKEFDFPGPIHYHNSKESMVFYSETTGIPLFMLSGIDRLKGEFSRNIQLRPENKYLRYTDKIIDYLKPLTIQNNAAALNKILVTLECLIEVITLGIVKYTTYGNQAHEKQWTVETRDPEWGTTAVHNLGKMLDTALVYLGNNDKLVSSLKGLIQVKVDNESSTGEMLESIYYALHSNYQTIKNYIADVYREVEDAERPELPLKFVHECLLEKYREKIHLLAVKSNPKVTLEEVKNRLNENVNIPSFDRAISETGYYDSVFGSRGLYSV